MIDSPKDVTSDVSSMSRKNVNRFLNRDYFLHS